MKKAYIIIFFDRKGQVHQAQIAGEPAVTQHASDGLQVILFQAAGSSYEAASLRAVRMAYDAAPWVLRKPRIAKQLAEMNEAIAKARR
jgi:hypothetical protein